MQAAVLLGGGELIVTMGKHCNKAATHSSPITTASSCIPYLVSHNNHHCGEDEGDKGLKEEGGREERRGWKEKGLNNYVSSLSTVQDTRALCVVGGLSGLVQQYIVY